MNPSRSYSGSALGSDAVASAIQNIRARFLNGLETQLLEFESLKGFIAVQQYRDRALAEIGMRAHKIRGVAATLGFRDLGRKATTVDELFSRPITGSQFAAFWRSGEEALEMMLDEMEALLPE